MWVIFVFYLKNDIVIELFRPHRLTVRTAGSQSANRSSILREVTVKKIPTYRQDF